MSTTPETILLGVYRISRTALIEELRAQGHYLTGALEASITPQTGDEELNVMAYAYLQKLEQGIPASEIRVDTAALADMTKYVERRMGYRGSKAVEVAYLVLQKQAKEGNPTSGSYAYSTTGERTGATESAFRKIDDRLEKYVDNGFDQMIEDAFGNEPDELTI